MADRKLFVLLFIGIITFELLVQSASGVGDNGGDAPPPSGNGLKHKKLKSGRHQVRRLISRSTGGTGGAAGNQGQPDPTTTTAVARPTIIRGNTIEVPAYNPPPVNHGISRDLPPQFKHPHTQVLPPVYQAPPPPLGPMGGLPGLP